MSLRLDRRRRGGKVIVQCRPALKAIVKSVRGVVATASPDPLPTFDVHAPLMRDRIQTELAMLASARDKLAAPPEELSAVLEKLSRANESLQRSRRGLQACRKKKEFGEAFVKLSCTSLRAVAARQKLRKRIDAMFAGTSEQPK